MLRYVGRFLQRKLRQWLMIPTAAPPIQATLVEDAERKGISIHHAVLAKAGEKNLIHRRVEAPKLPLGVFPLNYKYSREDDPANLGPALALDSESMAPLYSYANQYHCGLGFPGYAYLAELSQRSEYRAPSETIAQEMTREFIKLVVKGKAKGNEEGEDADNDGDVDGGLEDTIQQLTEALEEFKVRDLFRAMAQLDGFFGRAQLYIDIDPKGRNVDEVNQLPLRVHKSTIPKGSLRRFKIVEPIWTTPYAYNATDPLADDFYVPRAWFVMGKRVHATRVLTFVMREVPDILKPSYNFGGLSMSQLMEPYVFQFLRTRNSVSDLIHNFSVMCLKTDMSQILSGEPDKPGGLMDRAKLFTQTRDNQALTVLDMDKEDLVTVNVPLSGLDELQAQAQEHMAAPSHIPLVKLLGVTPGGLNASSEGEIKVFYDFVRACQQAFFAPHLNTVLQILQLHLFGVIDDAIGFEFVHLSAPTVKELSEIRKANAETDALYIDKGVIDPAESRERVQADPDSGYDNLTGPPPEPPALPEGEAMATQHDLSETSAEAAHKRSMEADAAQQREAA